MKPLLSGRLHCRIQLILSNSNLKGERFQFELERDSNCRKSLIRISREGGGGGGDYSSNQRDWN